MSAHVENVDLAKLARAAKFERYGDDCCVFQTVPGAPAEVVIRSADMLLLTSRELMTAIVAHDKPTTDALAYAAQFLPDAAQAGYRSIGGEP